MSQDTDKLFSPITLGNLLLNNRVVMAPMTRSFSPNNIPTEATAAYYQRRAASDVGLIITEGTCVNHKAANGYPNIPFIHGDEALAGWKQVVDAVHASDGKIVPQLWHVGGIRKEGTEPDPSIPGYSPSGLLRPNKNNGVAMTQDDIDEVVEAFAQAASDAKSIGFDGIEIHGAHGYLVDQFFWEGTNQRTDQYGGNMANRSRFAVEIISAIRARVGGDFPIIFRYSQWKLQDYSAKLAQTPEQLEEFLTPLVAAGVDIFHCSSRRFWETEFSGSDLNLAGWTKKITGKPVISVGSVGLNSSFLDESTRAMSATAATEINSLEKLYQRINNDEFELIAVGRALLQDPEWATKVKHGRTDELEDYNSKSLEALV